MSDEREHFKKVHGVTDEQTLDAIEELSAESAALREEVGRLREALQRIGIARNVDVPCDPTDETKTERLCEQCGCDPHYDDCLIGIAQRALTSPSPAALAVPSRDFIEGRDAALANAAMLASPSVASQRARSSCRSSRSYGANAR